MMPHLIKMYIRHCAIGFAISALFVATLLWFDVARLWYLITHTDVGPLAVFLLWVFNGIVFAGVQFGIAIMSLKPDEADGSGTSTRLVPLRAVVSDSKTPAISKK